MTNQWKKIQKVQKVQKTDLKWHITMEQVQIQDLRYLFMDLHSGRTSQRPRDRARPAAVVKDSPRRSPAWCRTEPALGCSRSPSTHTCALPRALEPCCRSGGGTAPLCGCRRWRCSRASTCTGHDGRRSGTRGNTWSQEAAWQEPHHPPLQLVHWTIEL